MSQYKYNKTRRNRIKQEFVNALGGKCWKCGYDRCVHGFDFHHINPADKKFTISTSIAAGLSSQELLNEIKKCALLCSNCHRELHAGVWKLEEVVNIKFDESAFIKPEPIKANCEYCKIEITNAYVGQKYCSRKCYDIGRRLHVPLKEELEPLLWQLPMTKIALRYNVSDRSIKKWADSYKLDCPPRGYFLNKIMG